MEIYFQKIGNTQGRPSKFVKHDDGTTELHSIWKAKQDQIKREAKAIKRQNKAGLMEAMKIVKAQNKELKRLQKANIDAIKPVKVKKVKVVSEEMEAATIPEIANPDLDIDTANCSDEDFDKFIGAHKKAIKLRKFVPMYS